MALTLTSPCRRAAANFPACEFTAQHSCSNMGIVHCRMLSCRILNMPLSRGPSSETWIAQSNTNLAPIPLESQISKSPSFSLPTPEQRTGNHFHELPHRSPFFPL